MKHSIFLSWLFSACLLFALGTTPPARAEAPFTESERATIASVENHLSELDSIVADFVQIAPDGGLVSGKFYLQRPGKMRWQYDPPTPILMVGNNQFLTFYDYELDQRSDIPLHDTLAGFLAREEIRFGGDVVVTELEQQPGSLRLTMIQQAKPDDGSLTLEFATGPMQLRNMVVVDSVGQETTVSLNNAQYGLELDDALFRLENRFAPEIGQDKKGLKR